MHRSLGLQLSLSLLRSALTVYLYLFFTYFPSSIFLPFILSFSSPFSILVQTNCSFSELVYGPRFQIQISTNVSEVPLTINRFSAKFTICKNFASCRVSSRLMENEHQQLHAVYPSSISLTNLYYQYQIGKKCTLLK